MEKLVAVYGTLRQGCGNNRVLGPSEKLGLFKTPPHWEMFSMGGFPGVRNGDKPITLEVYRVTDECVSQSLDWLEGYSGDESNFYDKTTVHTDWGEAEMYVLQGEQYKGSPLIEGGDWNEWQSESYGY
jgi:gamma-glutamylcyclotransferase (GGCT)/AIG2-like uncharacterized protein YtfP